MKNFVKLSGLFVGLFTANIAIAQDAPPQIDYVWHNANIGAGGYISGIVFGNIKHDAVFIRADIGGAYRRDGDKWIPLLDWLPHEYAGLNGILSIGIDPVNNDKIYLLAGEYTSSNSHNAAFLISNDGGQSFTKTDLPFRLGGNEDGRGTGERIAINPANPQEIFIGTTQNGLWKSSDGGLKWVQAGFAGQHILFVTYAPDHSLYLSAGGKGGLYKSIDNGQNFTAIKGLPDNQYILQGKFDPTDNFKGSFIVTTGDKIGPNGIKDGGIFKILPDNQVQNIAPPRQNDVYGYSGISISGDGKIMLASTLDKWVTHDEIFLSSDGGTSWKSLNPAAAFDFSSAPWLLDYYKGKVDNIGHWISDIEIDPFDNNHALYVTGYGLWETHNLLAPQIKWSFNDAGIEETAIIDFKSPPKGAHLISAVGDISGFVHNNLDNVAQNSLHKPFLGNTRSVDYSDNLYTRTTDRAPYGFYSTDSGQNWQAFKTIPEGFKYNGGIINISQSGKSLVWLFDGKVFYSDDSGISWHGANGLSGISNNAALVAEKGDAEKFYIYNAPDGKLFKSIDGGKNFALTKAALTPWAGAIKAVPDNPDHIWAATYNGVYASDNGGDGFVKIAPFDAAWSVAFGKAAAGVDYPAIFVAGKIGDLEGVFMSVDMGGKWIKISNSKQQFSSIRIMEGDPRILGRLYIGTDGRGIFYGDIKLNQISAGDKK